jgi:hypothetical protein
MQSNIFLVQKNIAPGPHFHYTLGPSQSVVCCTKVAFFVCFLTRSYPVFNAPWEVSRVWDSVNWVSPSAEDLSNIEAN